LSAAADGCDNDVTVPFIPELRVATMAAVLALDFPMVAVCFASCLQALSQTLAPDPCPEQAEMLISPQVGT
jgi:hypothetical protein